jgi:hypothetical protein
LQQTNALRIIIFVGIHRYAFAAERQVVSRRHVDRDINRVIDELRRGFPEIDCEQLRVKHPGADDDGLWFFTHPHGVGEVQLESSDGMFPFMVEGNDSDARDIVHTVEQAAALVARRLKLH